MLGEVVDSSEVFRCAFMIPVGSLTALLRFWIQTLKTILECFNV